MEGVEEMVDVISFFKGDKEKGEVRSAKDVFEAVSGEEVL